MAKPYHIVFTTIYHPLVLADLARNITQHEHLSDTKIWVVGDKKTPATLPALTQEISTQGLEVVYLDVTAQDQWGATHPDLYDRIPFNNETRRNIGYLHALAEGCEVLISIDDDNFPTDDDFVGNHAVTGSVWSGQTISEPHGFHNVCEHITFEPARAVFARGFPFNLRGTTNTATLVSTTQPIRIGANVGLWLLEPDVDATTWLNGKITGTGFTGDAVRVLHQDTWMPINTQNTSVVRDLIPAFLCVPMGWDVPGGKIQRYGDIWGGYFLQALMQGSEYHIAFGRPLVEHRRNPHNYVDDLRHEFWGTILTDWLVNLLRSEFKPIGTAMPERIHELGDFLEKHSRDTMPEWAPGEMRQFLIHTAQTLRHWSDACERIQQA